MTPYLVSVRQRSIFVASPLGQEMHEQESIHCQLLRGESDALRQVEVSTNCGRCFSVDIDIVYLARSSKGHNREISKTFEVVITVTALRTGLSGCRVSGSVC